MARKKTGQPYGAETHATRRVRTRSNARRASTRRKPTELSGWLPQAPEKKRSRLTSPARSRSRLLSTPLATLVPPGAATFYELRVDPLFVVPALIRSIWPHGEDGSVLEGKQQFPWPMLVRCEIVCDPDWCSSRVAQPSATRRTELLRMWLVPRCSPARRTSLDSRPAVQTLGGRMRAFPSPSTLYNVPKKKKLWKKTGRVWMLNTQCRWQHEVSKFAPSRC